MPKYSIIAAALLLLISMAQAQDQNDLYSLLASNPEMSAAEALSEAAQGDLAEARGGRLPQLRIEGQIGRLEQSFTIPVNGQNQTFDQTTDPMAVRATLEQAVFTSGVLSGAINVAKANAGAAKFSEAATRQNVILSGATAMANLVQARGILTVRRQNEETISQRLEESRSRFGAGLATKTDVLQSESRLAAATADRVMAESRLRSSEEEFVRVFGQTPPLDLMLPTLPNALPADLEEVIWLAEKEGPILEAQRQSSEAARYAVREARGRSLPQVSLSAEASTAAEQAVAQFTGDTESYGVFLNVSVDLFNGGANRARARAAKSRSKAAKFQLEQTRRDVRQAVIDSWTMRRAALSSIKARQGQVLAAQQSRDGVVREAEANRRTRLDVLDAELELANAQVSRLEAERDAVVAEFTILALVGRL